MDIGMLSRIGTSVDAGAVTYRQMRVDSAPDECEGVAALTSAIKRMNKEVERLATGRRQFHRRREHAGADEAGLYGPPSQERVQAAVREVERLAVQYPQEAAALQVSIREYFA